MTLAEAKATIDGFSPLAFPVVLAFALWSAQWAVRRFAPKAWEFMADLIIADKLKAGEVVTRFDLAFRKAWQAIPSAVVGAVALSVMGGGSFRDAALGAVYGLLAPALHEVLKALPGPYGGRR